MTCQFVFSNDNAQVICCGDPEERWVQSMAEASYQAQKEMEYLLDLEREAMLRPYQELEYPSEVIPADVAAVMEI